jgi:DNA polymerase
MRTLAIDIETFSSNDLIKGGVYSYVESSDFEILLFAYCFDNGAVNIIDLKQGEEIPADVLNAITEATFLKTAFNANFERVCIAKHFQLKLQPFQWECSSVKASMLGLPLSLDGASKALKLTEGKDAEGKALIRYFSLPCKPTKANSGRIRNLPEHAPEKWERYKQYCVQDVIVEQEIRKKISFFQIPVTEKALYDLDQQINDRGVKLDVSFIQNAVAIDKEYNRHLMKEAVQLTKLDNPKSVMQLKEWLIQETGEEIKSLNKETVPLLLKSTESTVVKRVLQIRQEISKTSIKKYNAMLCAKCSDSRFRGLLQFYGANRTGRWAGRLVQVQNLPKNDLPDLDLARKLIAQNDGETFELLYNVPDVLSQLIRTAFIAKENHRFIVADFSAIEARVIAWLANEKWRLDVFATHGKIYEASASQMFKVSLQDVKKGSPLRQKGKVAELALGYQGGPGALVKMGALKQGLTEQELPVLVKMWRNANKKIVALWGVMNEAAVEAIKSGIRVPVFKGVSFYTEKNILFMQLPSGRKLSYLRPKLQQGQFGEMICYEGMDQTTKKWKTLDTYGGKLTENAVQAIARDLLAHSMLELDATGYNIVCHVHDEVICEMPFGKGSVEEISQIMARPVLWAKDLPLKADAYETIYYKKD